MPRQASSLSVETLADIMDGPGPDRLAPAADFISWDVETPVKLRAANENGGSAAPLMSLPTVFRK